ncbi:hypothetical protein [Streptomyces formicae]|nr:hypothetical protein [Streptomyces formicae]
MRSTGSNRVLKDGVAVLLVLVVGPVPSGRRMVLVREVCRAR